MAVFHVPNETSARRLYVKTEAERGVAVVPDTRLIADLTITPQGGALRRTEEATGGFDRYATPSRGEVTYGGNLSTILTFENGPQIARWWLAGGGDPATSASGAYTYRQAPAFDVDDVDAFTAYYSVPGLGMHSAGVTVNEGTISMDFDDADGSWKFAGTVTAANQEPLPGGIDGVATAGTTTSITMTGAGWTIDELVGAYVFLHPETPNAIARQITDNTEDSITVSAPFPTAVQVGNQFRIPGQFPAGVATPSGDAIPTATTDVFVDAAGEMGTTLVVGRMIMGSVTVQNNRYSKAFMGSDRAAATRRTGRRGRVVTGQIRVEHDQWYEYDRWKALDELDIRFQSLGPEISPGVRKLAQLDLHNVVFDEPSDQKREANLTRTYGFLGFTDDAAPIIDTTWRNTLPQLA